MKWELPVKSITPRILVVWTLACGYDMRAQVIEPTWNDGFADFLLLREKLISSEPCRTIHRLSTKNPVLTFSRCILCMTSC